MNIQNDIHIWYILGNSRIQITWTCNYFYFYSKVCSSDYHSKKLTQLREAFKHSKIKKMDISLTSISHAPALDEVSKMWLFVVNGQSFYK